MPEVIATVFDVHISRLFVIKFWYCAIDNDGTKRPHCPLPARRFWSTADDSRLLRFITTDGKGLPADV